MNRKTKGNFDVAKKYVYFVPKFNEVYRLILISLSIIIFIGCRPKTPASDNQIVEIDTINGPKMHFYYDTKDLGTLKQGDEVNCEFRFKNTGKANLLITHVSAGCGCTSTQWETKPIKPGEESSIKVVFNSKNKIGRQNKTVSVSSNAQKEDRILKFTCQVVSPNKSQE
jgi:hypothetical protein